MRLYGRKTYVALLACFCGMLITNGVVNADWDCAKDFPLSEGKLNWVSARKNDWNVVTLSSSKMKRYSMPKSIVASDGCYTQGGVITEDYYVISSFCGDTKKSRVNFVSRKTNKLVKYYQDVYGHMNSFYYKWGTKQVRINGDVNGKSTHVNTKPDRCYQFGNKLSDFKEIPIKNCKTKRQESFGQPHFDVNGTRDMRGGLTGQGSATVGGYGYNVGWDSGCSYWGQLWSYEKDTNGLFVVDAGETKLLKSYYIPEPKLEIEDVSIDGDGNVWLIYNGGPGKPAIYYMVKRSDLDIPKTASERKKEEEAKRKAEAEKTNTGKGTNQSADNDKNKSSGDSSNTGGSGSTGGSSGSSSSSDASKSGSSNSAGGSGGSNNTVNKADIEEKNSENDEPKTIILKEDTIDGVLKTAIEVLSVLVPVVGTIGIGITGIQYMMAGGDEAKATKAKWRMLEIVVGMVIAVLMYGVLKFFGVA